MRGPLVEELTPAPDPLETCARFADGGLPHLVFLDGANYSFLCADPVAVVRVPDTPDPIDPIGAARALLAPHHAQPIPDLPPFQAGLAGFIGYDWGAERERVIRPANGGLPIPDVFLGLYDWVITWDHAVGRAWIVSTGIGDSGLGP